MTAECFIRRYRIAVLAVGAAWRLFVLWPAGARYPLEAVVYGLGLGLLPYAALAFLPQFIGTRWVLVAAAIAVLGIDVAAFVAAQSSESSTGGVAVLLAPIVSTFMVLTQLARSAALSTRRESWYLLVRHYSRKRAAPVRHRVGTHGDPL